MDRTSDRAALLEHDSKVASAAKVNDSQTSKQDAEQQENGSGKEASLGTPQVPTSKKQRGRKDEWYPEDEFAVYHLTRTRSATATGSERQSKWKCFNH